MKTEATLPFGLVINEGEKYHEPLAHHDGVPLASVIHDANNRLFFGIAVHAEGWDWPLCIVPITSEEKLRLETPEHDWRKIGAMYRELLSRAEGYYLWEMLSDLPEDEQRFEFVAGAVPEDNMPSKEL